ncbi:isoaspartyl peptidase/L-asparaginase [Novosphingobium sp. 1949]|uniref:Isoaspartyl peptidase/L-asparaginase n=1 Tax=Novosphingobium organovorum TaxID=2930092 RepID=A0ABT0BC95_9SPHN|nr:isoaspartyl peptidase/L-asparaginase [Novosphingobium organovorum]MCJ2182677.1 isoaspartyl peptidase/L-asparaginase [Novosphingobium organovorum]
MTTRREIMGLALSGTLAAAVAGSEAAQAAPSAEEPAFIVSTWDFGAAANAAAFARFSGGGSLIDAVEAGAQVPEADAKNQSVGLGGNPDRDGHVTLDAIIMDGAGNCGAVAAMEGFVHAISVARRVMEKTPHTFIVGEGAAQFAREQGFHETNLLTPESEAAWREWLKTSQYKPEANIENRIRGGRLNHDTIGILACNTKGELAGACTTSGMAYKLHGRVGDSPQAGCGLFVEGGVGAAAATGLGEEVTRIAGTARVVASMRAGLDPEAACREAVAHIARLRGEAVANTQVGFVAINTRGEVGAYSLVPGFTVAITDRAGKTRVVPAKSLSGPAKG